MAALYQFEVDNLISSFSTTAAYPDASLENTFLVNLGTVRGQGLAFEVGCAVRTRSGHVSWAMQKTFK